MANSHENQCGGSRPVETQEVSPFAALAATMHRMKTRTGCGTPQRLIESCFGCDDERAVTTAPASAVAVLA
jgi:hypothetical protein